MKAELEQLLEISKQDFEKLFDSIDHAITCGDVPASSIRLHFIRHNASGRPNLRQLVEVLINYITHYCFKAEKRKDLTEAQRTAVYRQARSLFRKANNSGQAGELMLFFFIDAVLDAPQIVKKMPITTNTNDERKGSDGIHMRWVDDDGVLEVIFGEAKLHRNFSAALKSAFTSMTVFHESETKLLEGSFYTGAFSTLSAEMQEKVLAFTEGGKQDQCREVSACLVGFNWEQFERLTDARKTTFAKEFKTLYLEWAQKEMKELLHDELTAFKHKDLRFEFFFIPFQAVDNFRALFLQEL